MFSNYKFDEKQLTEIIKKNVKPVDTEFSNELFFFKFDFRILLLKITLISLHVNIMMCTNIMTTKWNVITNIYLVHRTDFRGKVQKTSLRGEAYS